MKRKHRRGPGPLPTNQSQTAGRNRPQSSQHKTRVPQIRANASAAIPGEFEPQEALVFGCGQLVRYYPQLFVDFVRNSHEHIQLIGIVAPQWRRLGDLLLGASGLPMDAVEFIEGTTSSVWARDWSPILGYDPDGIRTQFYLDRSHMRHRDDVVARDIFQNRLRGPVREIPLCMEGGNFLSNGRGLILTSDTVEHTNNSRYKRPEIANLIQTSFASDQWAALLQLHGERTGHVDLFATFLAADLLLIGSVQEKDDEISHRALEDAAEKLQGLQTSAGKLRIERIPMPSSRDTYYRSYNNVIFANGVLLVPIFPQSDPKLDRLVIEMYRDYLPGWEVKGLDMSELSKKGGGLHCLSANVPPLLRDGTGNTPSTVDPVIAHSL